MDLHSAYRVADAQSLKAQFEKTQPKLSLTFSSFEQLQEHIAAFCRLMGFKIVRKHSHRDKKNDVLKSGMFVCGTVKGKVTEARKEYEKLKVAADELKSKKEADRRKQEEQIAKFMANASGAFESEDEMQVLETPRVKPKLPGPLTREEKDKQPLEAKAADQDENGDQDSSCIFAIRFGSTEARNLYYYTSINLNHACRHADIIRERMGLNPGELLPLYKADSNRKRLKWNGSNHVNSPSTPRLREESKASILPMIATAPRQGTTKKASNSSTSSAEDSSEIIRKDMKGKGKSLMLSLSAPLKMQTVGVAATSTLPQNGTAGGGGKVTPQTPQNQIGKMTPSSNDGRGRNRKGGNLANKTTRAGLRSHGAAIRNLPVLSDPAMANHNRPESSSLNAEFVHAATAMNCLAASVTLTQEAMTKPVSEQHINTQHNDVRQQLGNASRKRLEFPEPPPPRPSGLRESAVLKRPSLGNAENENLATWRQKYIELQSALCQTKLSTNTSAKLAKSLTGLDFGLCESVMKDHEMEEAGKIDETEFVLAMLQLRDQMPSKKPRTDH